MSKVLITKNNTVWGVIINPVSTNKYRDILSFPNEALKEAFINLKLFDDINFDFKKVMSEMGSKALIRETSPEASTVIDLEWINNELKGKLVFTIDDLLNADFMIVEENGKYYYYAITSAIKSNKQNQNLVYYTLSLDVFFNLDIKDIFNNKSAIIDTAHHDRYNEKLEPILGLDTPNLSMEEFNGGLSENSFIPQKIYNDIQVDYRHLITVESEDDDALDRANTMINNIKWGIVYSTKELFPNSRKILFAPRGGTFTKDAIPDYYYVSCMPISPYTLKYQKAYEEKVYEFFYFSEFVDRMGDNPEILSITISNLLPIEDIRNFEKKHFEFIIKGNTILIKDNITHLWPNFSGVNFVFHKDSFVLINKTIVFDLYSGMKSKPINLINDITPISLNINEKVDFSQEVKSYISNYNKYRIKGPTNDSFDIFLEYLQGEELYFYIRFGYLLDNWNMTYKPIALRTIYMDTPTKYELMYNNFSNYSLNLNVSIINEYLLRNKAQLNNKINASEIGIGASAMTIAGGVATFNPLVIGMGVIGLFASINKLKGQFAMVTDLKNTPNKIQSNGSTLMSDFGVKHLTHTVFRLTLRDIDLLALRQHFYTYGVKYGILKNINDVINTRYYFNFIKVEESFENIAIRVSPEIKQIINDSMANGLHIWHVRDLDTFKGIKDFTVNNVEMKLLNNKNEKNKN